MLRLMLCILCCIVTCATARAVELHFAYQDSENAPYQLGEGSVIPQQPGFAVELMQAAAARAGVTLKLERLPWKRAMEMLRIGAIDGVFSASYSSERLDFGVYPNRNGAIDPGRKSYTNAYVLYKRNGSPVAWDGSALTNVHLAIGTTRGFSVVGDLKRLGVEVEESDAMPRDFDKLLLNRLDGVAALALAAQAYLRERPDIAEKVDKLDPPLQTKDYYLLLSHQLVISNPQLAESFWDAIAAVRESARFKSALSGASSATH